MIPNLVLLGEDTSILKMKITFRAFLHRHYAIEVKCLLNLYKAAFIGDSSGWHDGGEA